MTQRKPRDARKERQCRQWITAWQASGLSVRVLCTRHGLAEPSFYAWRKELTRRHRPSCRSRSCLMRLRPGPGV